MLWALGGSAPESVGPARWLNAEIAAQLPQSILAAPVTASLILLAAVLVFVEMARVLAGQADDRQTPDLMSEAPETPAA